MQHGFEQRKKEGEISCSLGKGNKGTLSKYNHIFACTNTAQRLMKDQPSEDADWSLDFLLVSVAS